ncbi:uncharacterized protein LOC62_05G007507 [Vanrija pseudolonga]|uniref:Uncharacterized protein n=1 Tax=Vanrija pseudolonga TaxID=143232 RepID=A0AAF0YFL7_9TREE|nr:hypothetical protein LOC62_05G007507 [Vanrija pseudolonga]
MPHQRSSSSTVESKQEAPTPTATTTAPTPRRPPPTRIPSYAPSAPSTPLQSPPVSLRSSGSVSPSKVEPKPPTSIPVKSLPPKAPVSTPVKKSAPPSPVKASSPPSTPKPARVFTKEEAVIHPLDTSVLSSEKIPESPSPVKTTAPSSPTKGPRSPLSPAALAPPALSPPHSPGSSIELDVLGEKRSSLVSEVVVEDPKFKDKATQTPTKKSNGGNEDEALGDIDARDASILTFFAEQGAHPPETRNPTPAVTPRSSTTFSDFVAVGADPALTPAPDPAAPVTPSGKNNASLGVISNMWRGMRRSLSTSGAPPSVKGSPPRSSKEDTDSEKPTAPDAPSAPSPLDPATPAEDLTASPVIPQEIDRTATPYIPSDRFGDIAELLGPHFEGKTNSDQRHLKAALALDELLSLAHPSTIRDVMDDMHRRAPRG